MEELCKIAKAHYQASSDDIQKTAREFFRTLDRDDNGQVDLREFLTFMAEEGYAQMTSSYFFQKLDLDQNGTLDFWEVMALYYIVKSGRPFCDNCKHFIPGTYFTCVGCLEGPIGGTFYLCLDCHLGQKIQHDHDGVSQFLDNFSLLEAKIRSATNLDHQSRSIEVKSRPSTLMHQSSSSAMVPYSNNTAMVPYSNNTAMVPYSNNTAMVPATNANTGSIVHLHLVNNYYPYPPSAPTLNPFIPERQKWKIALGALDAAIKIGAIGTTIATCSIL